MRNYMLIGLAALLVAFAVYWITVAPDSASIRAEQEKAAAAAGRSERESQIVQLPVIEDPRVAYTGIFRNIHPDVKYLGDENCKKCHEDICTTFHAHPMGRSASIAGSDDLETYGPEAKNPSQVGPYQLLAKLEDGKMVHQVSAKMGDGEELPTMELPVSIAIGSGTRGRSYLVMEGPLAWQSPISWFSTVKRWDVSPGFDLGTATQRPAVNTCLYCHVNQNEPVKDTINRYKEPLSAIQLSIGCERCHGPGEVHSKERTDGLAMDEKHPGIDTSIVNPAHLTDDLQMSICAQCHLSGKTRVVRRGRAEQEFRPGLPFELFVNAFLAHPEAQFKNKAVGHFDQMEQTKCRTATGGKLLCSTCHDPHVAPPAEEANRLYLKTCIDCHQQQPCNAPELDRQKQNDDCIKCHMPSTGSTNIAHTSLTDHRILRDPSAKKSAGVEERPDVPMVPYRAGELAEAERERDLGIALARFAEKQPPGSELRNRSLELAKEKLTTSTQQWPDDTDALLALSTIGVATRDGATALLAAERAYKASPKNEDVLAQLAFVADGTGKIELSLRALNELLISNPSSQEFRLKRMVSMVAAENWEQAELDCRELLHTNPLQPTARLIHGLCLYGSGEKAAGRREVEVAMNLATSQQQRASIKAWFDRFVAWQAKAE
jgi:hypothetical protein